ncbi:MAG: hypothetical protein PVI57_05110 [Gemmatimonadota bacterium]|jgi:hypothetical protein
MLTLKILGGVMALLLGLWLGLPGRYQKKSDQELERLLDHGGGTRHRVKRHFTPLDWFRTEQRGSRRRQERSHFRTTAPDHKDR